MRILFNIAHPAQVHLFKNVIWNLEKRGHICKISIVDKEVSIQLLNEYEFEYTVVGKERNSLFSKATELLVIEKNLYRLARDFKPDVLVGGVGNAYVAHVGIMISRPSIIFDDTEHSKIERLLTDRFATIICTPNCFKKDLGRKQVRYNGCHELAYLHPKYFSPNPSILNEIGVSERDNIFLIRFAAFKAAHDIKSHNFRPEFIMPLIKKLEKKGKIIISSETKLDPHLMKYQYSLSPDKYHSVLYYSKMYIGEGSTSAEEAALLGVPSLHFERLTINGEPCGITPYIGIIDVLQNKYGLLYSYYDELKLLSKVDELLLDLDKTKKQWEDKRNKLLNDMVDVTDFIVQTIEKYSQ
ncbi:DUF354 domain-containing protein [Methanosarcina barkeri]|uniref:DUF354 domain-containing protein n=1 Tax=Methanosarcina barkeri 227 TaxID=1434106 RepID=A0A0E3R3K8_METBA|nr:DUF354 domain-containing protein [Methanosarcina barkeri]AKB58113.1 hypothetical protein MSBR2_1597 [Methanosarcina barkeri 227]